MSSVFSVPLCDPCGERVEMMMSVHILIGEPLSLQDVAEELCSVCSNVLRFAIEENT